MTVKTKILISILVIAIVLAGWWIVNNYFKEQKRAEWSEKVTCDEKCKLLGYESGTCRSFPIVPGGLEKACKDDERGVGDAIDCKSPKDKVGVGVTCCCKLK